MRTQSLGMEVRGVERCGGAAEQRRGKPTAGLVGVADKKADVAQPLDPRSKVGLGVE
jgi:hypothetical protein